MSAPNTEVKDKQNFLVHKLKVQQGEELTHIIVENVLYKKKKKKLEAKAKTFTIYIVISVITMFCPCIWPLNKAKDIFYDYECKLFVEYHF